MKVRIYRVATNETIMILKVKDIIEISKLMNKWYGEDNTTADFEIIEENNYGICSE